jgi:pyruvate formate lyase activating enzyme
MLVSAFLPQSFLDWKGKVAAVVFTPGCNLRCGYCHNPELLAKNPPTIDAAGVLKKIGELAWALDGVVITGGEPTLQEGLEGFCDKIRAMGLKVKLDTNGTLPEKVKALLSHVDFVAMDVKAPLDEEHVAKVTAKKGFADAMRKSVALIVKSGVEHEFRTTWDPHLSPEDVLAIAASVPTTWVLQEFRPIKCFDERYMDFKSTDYDLLKETAGKAKGPKHVSIRSEHHGEEKIR